MFSVGLIKAINALNEKKITNIELAKKAIFFEQKVMGETVGSQDQVSASIGDLIRLLSKKIILSKKN